MAGLDIMDEGPEPVDNNIVWIAINRALTDLGMKHEGGGDGSFGFEDEYSYGSYKVTIGMKNV